MSTPFESTNLTFQDRIRSAQVQEFVPRVRTDETANRQRHCSHKSSNDDDSCALDQLLNAQPQAITPPTPSFKDGQSSESLSSLGSSSSLHTHSAGAGIGHGSWYGQGWTQSSIWTPPVSTPITMGVQPVTVRSDRSTRSSKGSSDDYHLVSMADKFDVDHDERQGDKDPIFNPSLARSSFSTPPLANHATLHTPLQSNIGPTRPMIDASQFSDDQIVRLFAAMSAMSAPSTGSQSPLMSRLIAKAERLAKGLETPPPNRGFRPKGNEVDVYDETNTTVFVGGLSEKITETILNDLFAPFGPITYVKVLPEGRCGFVHFQFKDQSEYAIKQMQGFEVMGCSLRTNSGNPNSGKTMPAVPSSEEVKQKVVNLCGDLGVPTGHTEMVLKVLSALSPKPPGSVGSGTRR